ncbi:MAG: DUF1549 and DUF1553 domain-containing protein [Planctomycetota bacterium]|nr:DUF1549 and DUF1553 domain-containing protein [Planctomycetota bacterium]
MKRRVNRYWKGSEVSPAGEARRLCFYAVLFAFGNLHRIVAGEIAVFPSEVDLHNRMSFQRIVVQKVTDAGLGGQVVDKLSWSINNPEVVRIEDGILYPLKNGNTTVEVRQGGSRATIEVTVRGQDAKFRWSFQNHVEPVLSKRGCNGGACHGARAGQGGFRLTLFGYDLEADYAYLTRQANGRRVVPSDPGRSLILTKPTGLVAHKGGVRLDVNGRNYQILSQWIAQGATGPVENESHIERLEVLPAGTLQEVGGVQQLVVIAHFSDGSREDVTNLAKYTSVHKQVSSVDDSGEVQFLASGESAVNVWYLNLNSLAFATVPFPVENQGKLTDTQQPNNLIDQLVLKKLRQLRIPSAPLCNDETFIRRAYLDTMGILPSVEQVRAFISDPAPSAQKRIGLIDNMLASSEFTDYWTYRWSDLLLVNGEVLRPAAVKTYYQWIRDQVSKNQPWDDMVRELVVASGSTLENGAANFYAIHQSPEDMSETVAQAFMGLSINCAKCHNHPLEKWTNDEYYAMANMFSRVRAKGWGGDPRNGSGDRTIFVDLHGELIQPSTGTYQPPQPLDGKAVPVASREDRRVALAQWLTSPDNPYFTRAIANRIWANFMGVGIVENIDDLRVTNPPSNEELLNYLSRYLVEHEYDLKDLMREILVSATYQRSSATSQWNEADDRFYSHYYPRRLKAEVLLDAVSVVTGVPTTFKDYPTGTRALQLHDSSVESYFLSTFGRPERVITCECERSDEPSMTQVLHLVNGETITNKLESEQGKLAALVAGNLGYEEMIRTAYVSALSREPLPEEVNRLTQILNESSAKEDRRLAVEDLYWSLMTSREFLFNH